MSRKRPSPKLFRTKQERGPKTKFKRIQIAGGITKDLARKEARWIGRDLYRKIRQKAPKVKAVVVDVDGNLVETNIYKALASKNPKLKAEQERLLKDVKSLKKDFNSGFKEIADKYAEFNIKTSDLDKILNKMSKEYEVFNKGAKTKHVMQSRLNYPMISALKELQKQGVKVIIATRTSNYVAEYLNKMLKFDGAIGSEEVIKNGKFVGMKNMVGIKNEVIDGMKVRTKSKAVADKYGFKEKNLALISEEASDFVGDASSYDVFFQPKKPIEPAMTKFARFLRTYDVKLKEGDPEFAKKLVAFIENPKTQYSKKLLAQELKNINVKNEKPQIGKQKVLSKKLRVLKKPKKSRIKKALEKIKRKKKDQ